MNDMSGAIVPKSDQINADDLISGPITITIESVEIKGGQEQPVSIFFAGSEKAFRPCKSMSRVLVAAWGPDANKYVGRSLTLYRDPTVKWGGMDVGGIRISHMTDIDNAMTMALTATKGSRKPFTVKPLVAAADKVADGVRDLVRLIKDAGTAAEVEAIANDPAVIKQRTWLAKNRSAMAAQVDDAFTAARQASGTTDDDPFATAPQSAEIAPPVSAAEPAGDPPTDAEQDEAASYQPGRDDSEMGEVHTTADAEADIIAHIGRKVRISDVNGIINSRIGELDEDGQDRVRSVAMDRIAEIRAAEKVDG